MSNRCSMHGKTFEPFCHECVESGGGDLAREFSRLQGELSASRRKCQAQAKEITRLEHARAAEWARFKLTLIACRELQSAMAVTASLSEVLSRARAACDAVRAYDGKPLPEKLRDLADEMREDKT